MEMLFVTHEVLQYFSYIKFYESVIHNVKGVTLFPLHTVAWERYSYCKRRYIISCSTEVLLLHNLIEYFALCEKMTSILCASLYFLINMFSLMNMSFMTWIIPYFIQ